MARKQLREDITKISQMMGYDRGLTLTENKAIFETKQLQEQNSKIIPFENYRDISVSWEEDENGNDIIDMSALGGLASGLEDATDTPIDDEDVNDVYRAVLFLKDKWTSEGDNACEKVLELFGDKTGNEDLEQNILKAGMARGFSAIGWSDDDDMYLDGVSTTYGAAKRKVAKAIRACTRGSMTTAKETQDAANKAGWPAKYKCVLKGGTGLGLFPWGTKEAGKFQKTKSGSVVYIVPVDSKTAQSSGGNLQKEDKLVYYSNGTMRVYPRGKSGLADSKGPFPFSCNRNEDMEFEASVDKTDVEVSEVWGEDAHEYRRHNVGGVEKRAGEGPEVGGHRHFKDYMGESTTKKALRNAYKLLTEQTTDVGGVFIDFGDPKQTEDKGDVKSDTEGDGSGTDGTDTPPKKKRSKWNKVTYTLETIREGRVCAKLWDFGDTIKQIQKLIGAKPDGYFGPKTQEALKGWQRRNGKEDTGQFCAITFKETEKTDVPGGTGDVDSEKDADAKPDAEIVTNDEVEEVKQTITSDSDASETLDYLADVKETKLDKPTCIQLVVAANAALPNLVPEILPKLQACFYDYNFPRGIGRRAVKKRYGITGKGRKK